MKLPRRLIFAATASTLIAIGQPGCTKEARVDRKLAAAREHFQNRNDAAAEIEFKNVLSVHPSHPEAMKSLGLIWVRQGIMLDGGRILQATKPLLPKDDELGVTLALAILELGFLADARKELLEVLDRSPAHGEALMLLAEASLTPEAMAECEQRIQASGTLDHPSVSLAAALIELRKGEIAAGSERVDRIIEKDPGFARAHALRGTILRAKKQAQEAVEPLKKAAELGGPDSRELQGYATLLMELERRDEAVALLTKATESAPDYLPNWRLLGKIAVSEGNDDEAAGYLKKVLAKSPLDIEGGLLMSQVWLRQNEPAKAVDLLEKLLAEIPSRPVVELALAKAHLAAGQPLKASQSLDRVLALVPGASEAVLLRTGLHLRSGQPAEAIELIEPLLVAQPANRMAQDLLVDAYRAANRADDAITVLQRQVAEAPDDTAPLLKLAQLLRAAGKFSEAREAAGKALAVSPDPFGAVSELALLDQQEGNAGQALERVEEYLKSHPDSPEAHYLKAGLHFTAKDFPAAEASLRKTIELEPTATPAYGMLVRIMLESGRANEAVAALHQLLEAGPADQTEARMQLGNLLMEQGRMEEALAEFEKLAELHPNHAAAHNNIAYLLSEHLDNLEKAAQSARKARALAPRDPAVSDTLGWIEWLRGNYTLALPLLNDAVAGLPGLPSAHYHLAMTHYMLGHRERAEAGLEKALSLDAPFPEKEEAEQRLASVRSGKEDLSVVERRARENPEDVVTQLQWAEGLAKAGRTKEALVAYQKALALNPELEAAWLGQFELYAGPLEDPAKALESAARARRVAPQSARALAAVGRARFLNGNHEEAYGLLKEASRNQPENLDLQSKFAWAAYAIGRVDEAHSAMAKAAAGASSVSAEQADFLSLTKPGRLQDPNNPALAKRVLQEQPDHAPALMLVAELEEQQGRDASRELLQILEIFPKFDPARKILARKYLEEPETLQEAEALALEARKRLPDDPEITRILALVNFRKGNFDYSAQLLKEIAAGRPLTGPELFALGMSQAAANANAEARNTLEEALKKDLSHQDAEQARTTLASLEEQEKEDR